MKDVEQTMEMVIRADLTALTSLDERLSLLDMIQQTLSLTAGDATSGSHLIQTPSFSITLRCLDKTPSTDYEKLMEMLIEDASHIDQLKRSLPTTVGNTSYNENKGWRALLGASSLRTTQNTEE